MSPAFPAWIVVLAVLGSLAVIGLVIAAVVASTSGAKKRNDV